MKNRTNLIPNNRYEKYLNELRDRAWNCMSKTVWDYSLNKFGRVQFGKSVDDQSTNDEFFNDESVNEYVVDEPINEPIADEPVNEHDRL